MSADIPNVRQVHGYCSLCIARCGTVATVTDKRFTRLDPDPTHPTGAAICAKGRAAPELVYHKDRLKRPLRRTRPKGDVDPGWEEISWDAALDRTAAAMRRIAEQHGPEAVAFSQSSPRRRPLRIPRASFETDERFRHAQPGIAPRPVRLGT